MGGKAPRFLVVEDDADGEFLIQRALRRRFPAAAIEVYRGSDEALSAAQTGPWSGCVIHRALDMDGIELVRRVRATNAGLAIVMMSGRDVARAATEAGANHFLRYNDWQQLSGCFEVPGP